MPGCGRTRVVARSSSSFRVYSHPATAPLASWTASALGADLGCVLHTHGRGTGHRRPAGGGRGPPPAATSSSSASRADGTVQPSELTLTGYRDPTITGDGTGAWLVMVRTADDAVVSRQFAPGAGWSTVDRDRGPGRGRRPRLAQRGAGGGHPPAIRRGGHELGHQQLGARLSAPEVADCHHPADARRPIVAGGPPARPGPAPVGDPRLPRRRGLRGGLRPAQPERDAGRLSLARRDAARGGLRADHGGRSRRTGRRRGAAAGPRRALLRRRHGEQPLGPAADPARVRDPGHRVRDHRDHRRAQPVARARSRARG